MAAKPEPAITRTQNRFRISGAFRDTVRARCSPLTSRWLPTPATVGALSLGAVVLATTLFFYAALLEREQVLVETALAGHAAEIETLLNTDLENRIRTLERMAKRWSAAMGTRREVWERDAVEYIDDLPGYKTMGWVDKDHVLQWVVPLAENTTVVGLDLRDFPSRYAQAEAARASGEVQTRIHHGEIIRGTPALVIYAPIFIEGDYAGLIIAVNDIQTWFHHLVQNAHTTRTSLILDHGSIRLAGFEIPETATTREAFSIQLRDIPLHLTVRPGERWLASFSNALPATTLAFGVILSVLAGTALRSALLVRRQARSLRRAIVARDRRARALHRSEERFRHAIDSSPIGFAIVALDGTWLKVNESLCRLLGSDERALVGTPAGEQFHPHDANLIATSLEHLQAGEPSAPTFEVRISTTDDRYFDVNVSMTLAVDDSGTPDYVVLQIQDVSDLKHSLQKLKSSNEELERFAYVASHDLQEPVRVIRSYTQLLAQRYLAQMDERGGQLLKRTGEAAERMTTLIRDLLDFARIENAALELSEVKTWHLVHSVVNEITEQRQLETCRFRIGELPNVYGDEGLLRQLFYNLISNAVKYHDPERPNVVAIGARRLNDAWEFWTSDTGIGIEPEHFEQIFVIFRRLHTKSEYEGTGIGLALCKKIVEYHGGAIRVDSTPGHGTTFTFAIPDRSPTLTANVA